MVLWLYNVHIYMVYETRYLHKPVGHIIDAAGNSRRVVGCSSSLLSGILSRDNYKEDTKHYDSKACLMQSLSWFLAFNNVLISFIYKQYRFFDFLVIYIRFGIYFKFKSWVFSYKIDVKISILDHLMRIVCGHNRSVRHQDTTID